MRKLEIGSGNRPLDGYEHLDIDPKCPHVEYVAPMDNIPAADKTFGKIKSVHVIEHQSWRDTKKILTEWYRVLAPSGELYIATPNLKFIAEMFLDGLAGGDKWLQDYNIMHPEEQAYIKIGDVPNVAKWANFKIFSSTAGEDKHLACYDVVSLTKILGEVGFVNITVQSDADSLVIKAFRSQE